jgi:hypothetical protein
VVGQGKGGAFEARVARLLAVEGAFVRTRVNLEPHFRERFTVTDLDVYAVAFTPTLAASSTVVECKTTEARNTPSAADRLMWLAGVKQLMGADHGTLATTRPASDALRELAAALRVAVADERDIERRELIRGVSTDSPIGPHGPAVTALVDDARRSLKADRELHRAYIYVRSELWLSQPASAVKRTLGALRLVGDRYSDHLPANEVLAIQWLVGELATGLALAVTRLAGEAYLQPEPVFDRKLAERFSEGLASYHALIRISKAVDEYLAGVLREAGVNPAVMVRSFGAFDPRPPAYLERLIELIQRFATAPAAAQDTARLADVRFARALSGESATWPLRDSQETSRLLRLLAAFILGQIRLPEHLLAPIVDERADVVGQKSTGPRNGSGGEPRVEADRSNHPPSEIGLSTADGAGAEVGDAERHRPVRGSRPEEPSHDPTLFDGE